MPFWVKNIRDSGSFRELLDEESNVHWGMSENPGVLRRIAVNTLPTSIYLSMFGQPRKVLENKRKRKREEEEEHERNLAKKRQR
jgi:hypothetical protein